MKNLSKQILSFGGLALTALTLLAVPATAGSEGPSGDSLISIQAKNQELPAVLSSMAVQIGAKLAIDNGFGGKISLELHDAKLRHAMDSICQAYSCKWSLQDHPLVLLVQAEPANPK